jgi:hypothetical protein
MGLLMPGQVDLLCILLATFLAGEHGHGLTKNEDGINHGLI